MKITIFTPAYNRGYTLPKLYESLISQSDKDFQWVIVDDGSTDNSEELIRSYIKENSIPIIYKKTENGGKMKAINHGLDLAQGELFFIVDSDDYISCDAVETIKQYYSELPENYAGLVFRKQNMSGSDFGNFPQKIIDSNPIDIFYRKKVLGDKAEIVKTEIFRKYKFPEIPGEKFIPEGLIWNKIGKRHPFRYIDYPIYFFEYIQDGYTRNFSQVMKNNPLGFKIYYKEMLRENIPLINKVKFFMRYLQSCSYLRRKNR